MFVRWVFKLQCLLDHLDRLEMIECYVSASWQEFDLEVYCAVMLLMLLEGPNVSNLS